DDDLNALDLFRVKMTSVRRAVLTHLCVEDVATSRYGLDVALLVIAQRLAHFSQAPRQLIVAGIPVGPHGLYQFIFTDEPFAVFDQECESGKTLGAQLYLFTSVQKAAPREIESEAVE